MFKKITLYGYDREIFSYLKSGIYGSATFATLSMAGFFITNESEIGNHNIFVPFQAVWLFTAVYALSAFIRMTSIQFKMLRQTMS